MREYIKKINYEFNALECALIVHQCETAILAEKHAAWQEIIDTMHDCEIVSEDLPHRSLHKFLKQYMETENKAIENFLEPNENAFYQFTWSYVSNGYKPYYRTVDECFSAAAKFQTEMIFFCRKKNPMLILTWPSCMTVMCKGALSSNLTVRLFQHFRFHFQGKRVVFTIPSLRIFITPSPVRLKKVIYYLISDIGNIQIIILWYLKRWFSQKTGLTVHTDM